MMPERLTIDEFIVATLVTMGPTDPAATVQQFRHIRANLARAAELHDLDLTLDDEISLTQVIAISHDATDLEGLRHEH